MALVYIEGSTPRKLTKSAIVCHLSGLLCVESGGNSPLILRACESRGGKPQIHYCYICDPLSENRPFGVDCQNLVTSRVGCINNAQSHSE
jgi:hypothetical protein